MDKGHKLITQGLISRSKHKLSTWEGEDNMLIAQLIAPYIEGLVGKGVSRTSAGLKVGELSIKDFTHSVQQFMKNIDELPDLTSLARSINEARSQLDEDQKELKKQNDDLNAALIDMARQVKDMKEDNDILLKERKVLHDNIESLEGQISELENQVQRFAQLVRDPVNKSSFDVYKEKVAERMVVATMKGAIPRGGLAEALGTPIDPSTPTTMQLDAFERVVREMERKQEKEDAKYLSPLPSS